MYLKRGMVQDGSNKDKDHSKLSASRFIQKYTLILGCIENIFPKYTSK